MATQVFHCQGCASEFILGAQELSATCSYCGSMHIVRQSRELASPDALLPFGLDRQQAARRVESWIEKHKVEPQADVEQPRALYLPVWTFDITGQIPWNGRVYKNKNKQPVSGSESLNLYHLAVPASHRSTELLTKAIRSYAMNSLVPYDPRYLSGWPAEVYELSMSDASLEARRQAIDQLRQTIHSQHGEVSDLTYSAASITVESFQLVLLPVWFTEYLSASRTFRIVINGLSGAVFGETPKYGLREWLGDLLDPGN